VARLAQDTHGAAQDQQEQRRDIRDERETRDAHHPPAIRP
jgi:hypothetical protein